MNKKYQYDVALSFAGEDRQYVEQVAQFLLSKGIRVFYDKFEEVNLWGRDLMSHFDEIYRKDARYCVMFISRYYAQKAWPRHEKQSTLSRALTDEGYILPARFDDTDIPGLPPTIHYIDLRQKNTMQLGEMIIKRLGKGMTIQQKKVDHTFRRPQVSKSFDPYKESQSWINYLTFELKKRCEESEISFTNFTRDGKQCFRFVINGKPIYSIDIQLGGFLQDRGLSISYSRGEMQLTSGYNAFADFEWDKKRECVVLKLNDFSMYSSTNSEEKLTQEKFLEYIWAKICDAVEEKY